MRHPEDHTDVTDHENCNCDQARALVVLVNRLVRERDEARKLAEFWHTASCQNSAKFLGGPLPWEMEEE